MKGSNSVFDTILEAGENKVTLFCDNLSTVFSHVLLFVTCNRLVNLGISKQQHLYLKTKN